MCNSFDSGTDSCRAFTSFPGHLGHYIQGLQKDLLLPDTMSELNN